MNLALCWVLGFSAAVDLALGAWASVAWGSFKQTWFVQRHIVGGNPLVGGEPQLRLMGLVLGLILLFFALLQGWAIRWIRKEQDSGFHLVILFGGYLVVSSIVTFWVFRGVDFLILDGIRGAVLVALGFLAMNEPSTVTELRLPKGLGERSGARGRRQQVSRTARGRRDRDGNRRRDRKGDKDRGRGPSRKGGRPAAAESAGGAAGRKRSEPGAPGGTPGGRGRRRSSGASTGDGRGPSRTRGIDNRSRSPEELFESESSEKLPARERGDETRSLAVVVRGGLPGERPSSEEEGAENGNANGRGSDRGRRRRRSRRSRGGESGGSADARTDAPASEGVEPDRGPEEAAEPMAVPESSASAEVKVENEAQTDEDARRETPERQPVGEPDEVLDMFDLLGDTAKEHPSGGDSEFGRTRRPAGPRRR
jgi:hypothetical protein